MHRARGPLFPLFRHPVAPLTTTGRVLECVLFAISAFCLTAQLICVTSRNGDMPICALPNESLLLTLHPSDTEPSFLPVFNRDGRLLAWGNQDGTASVCEMEELNRRLGEIRLGWRQPTRLK